MSTSTDALTPIQGYTAKIIIVGDAACGKTSLIKRYVHNIPPSKEHQTTIGVEFSWKKLKVENELVTVQVWDLAGQDRFQGLARIYYRDAVGAIVVFDMFNKNSFESAKKWKADIDSKVFLPNGEMIPVILVGNKYDLIERLTPAVTEEELERFGKENNFAKCLFTSAESNHNVKQSFNHLVSLVVQNHRKLKSSGVTEKVDDKIITNNTATNNASSCCA